MAQLHRFSDPASLRRASSYRAVRRWHFYASLFCTPFVIVLAVSGAIYLFKHEIEAWIERPYDHLEVVGSSATAAEQIRAALADQPGATFAGYELPQSPDAAARVLVKRDGETFRVYIHPKTCQPLGAVAERNRLMRRVFRAHGELLMGDRGSLLVELAASWTIVMILTGLYLWWPRQTRGLGGIVYPRLGVGSRVFWRDLHAVTGVWISLLALLLLTSGLPWAKGWGNYLKAARALAGAASGEQDWTIGGDRSRPARDSASEHSRHGEHGGTDRPAGNAGRQLADVELRAVDRIVAVVAPLELPPPVVIASPGGKSFRGKAPMEIHRIGP